MKKGGTAKKFINLFAPLAHDFYVESYEGWEGFLYAELIEFFQNTKGWMPKKGRKENEYKCTVE